MQLRPAVIVGIFPVFVSVFIRVGECGMGGRMAGRKMCILSVSIFGCGCYVKIYSYTLKKIHVVDLRYVEYSIYICFFLFFLWSPKKMVACEIPRRSRKVFGKYWLNTGAVESGLARDRTRERRTKRDSANAVYFWPARPCVCEVQARQSKLNL